MTIGMAEGVSTPSRFFLTLIPDGWELLISDCAVNIAPNVDELCDIARASMRSAEACSERRGWRCFPFPPGLPGQVLRWNWCARRRPGWRPKGWRHWGRSRRTPRSTPISLPARGLGGAEAANVLSFPSLVAGNMAYKLPQELGRAQEVGPLRQGFARPVCDLSRGASIDDIIAAAALTMATA